MTREEVLRRYKIAAEILEEYEPQGKVKPSFTLGS